MDDGRNEEAREAADADPVLSRRETLKIGAGIVMLGAGLGVALGPATAGAEAPLLSLHFFRNGANGWASVGSVSLPAELVAKLQSSNLDHVKVSWCRRDADQQLHRLGEHDLPGKTKLKPWLAKKPGSK